MAGKRIVAKDISVGEPLPWDVCDENGILLLRRGFVIDSQRALDRLLFDGIFLDSWEEDSGPGSGASPAVAAGRVIEKDPSALQFVIDARRLMGTPTGDLTALPDFSGRVHKMAGLVDRACDTDADVAVASTLLLQDDSYFARHHVNAAIVSNLVARAMAMPDKLVRSVTASALTMNISMYEVQDKLHDVKGQLNDKLKALISVHPQQSVQRLRKLGVEDDYWLSCVGQHHEQEDGSGYPNGLRSADIEAGAKIIGLAEKFCARISLRAYRTTQPPNVVLRELYMERGQTIDALVAAHLVRLLGVYPAGTIVKLRNGETGVVVKQSDDPEAPQVHAMLNSNGATLATPMPRKTNRDEFRIQDVLTLDKIDFPIQMSRLWGDAARIG